MSQQTRDAKMIGDYLVGKTIGQGTFGKVKIGTHTLTNQQVAIKVLEKSRIQEESDNVRVSRQIQILRTIRHPNIIQLYEIISTPSKLFLITEFADGGELFDLIVKNQRLDEFQASKFLQQILNAVEYMHEMGIAHRDLKPENLLLDYRKNIKVVDFGLSNLYKNDAKLHTACGSPCYAAPEMISGLAYDGLKTDIWSCGIILYAMLCGYLPFEDADTSQLYRKIKRGDYEIPSFVSFTAQDLLAKMLNVDPDRRATIQTIRKHNFCLKKQPLVKGISSEDFEPDEEVMSELAKYDMEEQTVRQQLLSNKHNRCTATYYLMLKFKLKQKNQTLLDYYRIKQEQQGEREKTVMIRRRKILSTDSQKKYQPISKPSSRENNRLSNLEIIAPSIELIKNISRELTKNTSKELAKQHSKSGTKTPILKLSKRPSKVLDQPPKHSLASLARRFPKSRVKSEVGGQTARQKSKEIKKLVDIIDKKLTHFNPLPPKPVLFLPHKRLEQQTPYNYTEQDNMLQRIYRKNINKLQQTPPSRVRHKSKV